MTVERLQEFLLLAETLNFSETAGKVFTTQSVLSRHIRDMEEELGFKLFVRNTRKVTLTEAGRQFFLDARALVRRSETAQNRLQIGGRRAAGTVRISATESSLGREMLDFLQMFEKKHPQVYLAMNVLRGKVESSDLLSGDFLFSPCNYPILPEGVVMEAAFGQAAHLAVARSHRLGKEKTAELARLEQERLFVPYDDEMYGPYARNKMLAEKSTGGKVNIFKVPNVATALLLVSLGRGTAIVPASLVPLEYSNVCLLKITDSMCNFQVNLYHNTEQDAAAAWLFRQELERWLQERRNAVKSGGKGV